MTELRQFVAMKAFIVHEGKILVIRESSAYEDGTQNPNQYGIPGGRIEPGEHHLLALQREIVEEVGISEVKIGRAFTTQEWRVQRPDKNWQIIATFLVCSVDAPVVQLGTDHDDYKWIEPARYQEENVYENLYPVFAAYLSLD